jgi:hypothetical protein
MDSFFDLRSAHSRLAAINKEGDFSPKHHCSISRQSAKNQIGSYGVFSEVNPHLLKDCS